MVKSTIIHPCDRIITSLKTLMLLKNPLMTWEIAHIGLKIDTKVVRTYHIVRVGFMHFTMSHTEYISKKTINTYWTPVNKFTFCSGLS